MPTRSSIPAASPLRRVILARHGETAFNVERRLRGRADPPLSEVGREQVRLLGEALATTKHTGLVSSPRGRAQETASAIAKTCGVAFVVDARLDDVDYGEWTGLTLVEAAARWPELQRAFLTDPDGVRFPNGESIGALVARTTDVLASSSFTADVTVLVTHDIVIRVLLCTVLGTSLRTMHRLRIDVASSTGLRVAPSHAYLDWMNDTCHLQSPPEREEES